MRFDVIVSTGKDCCVVVTLNLPVNACLEDLHDNIEKYVSCQECLSVLEGVFRDVSVSLDGCITTENHLSCFDVDCERIGLTKAYITIS